MLPKQTQLHDFELRFKNCNLKFSRRGFSFTELLFAVMILGIGFIMLAAIFPVGLSQTKSNFEENVAATLAKTSAESMSELAQESILPPTNIPYYAYTAPLPVVPLAAKPATTDPQYAQKMKEWSIGRLQPGESISLGTVMSLRDKRWTTQAYPPGPVGTFWSKYRWSWDKVQNLFRIPSDNRFAWTMLYMRKIRYTNNTAVDTPIVASGRNSTTGLLTITGASSNPQTVPGLLAEPEPIAQVFLIGMRINNRSQYDERDSYAIPAQAPFFYQLEPKPVFVQMLYNPDDGNYVAKFRSIDSFGTFAYHGFPDLGTHNGVYSQFLNAIAPGTVVIISDDRVMGPNRSCG